MGVVAVVVVFGRRHLAEEEEEVAQLPGESRHRLRRPLRTRRRETG